MKMSYLLFALFFILLSAIGIRCVKRSGSSPDGENYWTLNELKELLLAERISIKDYKYSMNFSGADQIVFHLKGPDGENLALGGIRDSKKIKKIISLLSSFPKEGEMMKKMVPHDTYSIYAVKERGIFSYVQFHRNMLKAENGAFFGHGDSNIKTQQAALFQIVKNHIKPIQLGEIEKQFLNRDFFSGSSYSQDFSGVEEILVQLDPADRGKASQYCSMKDPKLLKNIVGILKDFPREGGKAIKWGPVEEKRLVALKDGKAFAYVSIYDRSTLKSEGGGFFIGDEHSDALQKELARLIDSCF